jgi:hypothetical protein
MVTGIGHLARMRFGTGKPRSHCRQQPRYPSYNNQPPPSFSAMCNLHVLPPFVSQPHAASQEGMAELYKSFQEFLSK